MEDKTYELLTKMYSDITNRFDGIDTRLEKLEAGQVKIETTLENDIKTKLQALHEREAANSEKLDLQGKQLNSINNKLDYLALPNHVAPPVQRVVCIGPL